MVPSSSGRGVASQDSSSGLGWLGRTSALRRDPPSSRPSRRHALTMLSTYRRANCCPNCMERAASSTIDASGRPFSIWHQMQAAAEFKWNNCCPTGSKRIPSSSTRNSRTPAAGLCRLLKSNNVSWLIIARARNDRTAPDGGSTTGQEHLRYDEGVLPGECGHGARNYSDNPFGSVRISRQRYSSSERPGRGEGDRAETGNDPGGDDWRKSLPGSRESEP